MPEQSPQIEMHLRPGCRATGHQSAAAPETAERVVPRRGSDVLDHHIHAALVGQGTHLCGHLLRAVVEGHIGAELLRRGKFGVVRGGHDDPRADELGDAHRGQGHAPADSPYERRLTGPEVRPWTEYTAGCQLHERERSRLRTC